jgi:UPF0716 protein FxsA
MRMLLWLFLAAPLIELWFMIHVGGALGALPTIALLITAGAVGMSLLRQQSFNTLLRVDQRLQMGEMPAVEILEGFGLTLAGVLLIIPGFITDLLAIPLLIPPLRRSLVQRFLRTGYYHQRYTGTGQGSPFDTSFSTNGDIIDGECRHEDEPRLR